MSIKKSTEKLISEWEEYYEIQITPILAKYFKPLLYPAYLWFKLLNYKFLVNIASCTGHTTVELDYFFHMRHSHLINPNKRYVWIIKPNNFSKDAVKIFRPKFHKAIASHFFYQLTLPVLMAFNDLIVDCGLSHDKFQIMDVRKYSVRYPFLKPLSPQEGKQKWIHYYRCKQKSQTYFPFTQVDLQKQKIKKLLNLSTKKLALIHIKEKIANATGKITDPKSYLPSLSHLSELGYQLVFVGRERMPKIFECYNIINYSESDIASYEFDLTLFSIADVALVGGSGICNLAACFNIPFLIINAWQLCTPPHSSRCIMLPSLLQRTSGEYVSFSEQLELEYKSYKFNLRDRQYEAVTMNPLTINNQCFSVINATAEEILEAMKELLILAEKPSPLTFLQNQCRNINKNIARYYSNNRFSNHFLQKHGDLFNE